MKNNIKEHIAKYGHGLASAQKFATEGFKNTLAIQQGTIYAESIRHIIETCIEVGYKFGIEEATHKEKA